MLDACQRSGAVPGAGFGEELKERIDSGESLTTRQWQAIVLYKIQK
jgi:hypothetical protein